MAFHPPLSPEEKAARAQARAAATRLAQRRSAQVQARKARTKQVEFTEFQHPETYVIELTPDLADLSTSKFKALLTDLWHDLGISPVTVTFRLGGRSLVVANPAPLTGLTRAAASKKRPAA